MKKIISQIRFRTILPFLVMTVLLTLPSTVTGSKYVWNDTIDVELHVLYPENELTRMLPERYPSEFWVQNLTNIQAMSTADGLVLTADEGYALPEYITVKIGETTFSIKTDGTEAPEGFSFDPATGLLSVSEMYRTENSVVLQAEGVAVAEDETPEKTEPKKEAETPALDETEPSSDTVSLDQLDESDYNT